MRLRDDSSLDYNSDAMLMQSSSKSKMVQSISPWAMWKRLEWQEVPCTNVGKERLCTSMVLICEHRALVEDGKGFFILRWYNEVDKHYSPQ